MTHPSPYQQRASCPHLSLQYCPDWTVSSQPGLQKRRRGISMNNWLTRYIYIPSALPIQAQTPEATSLWHLNKLKFGQPLEPGVWVVRPRWLHRRLGACHRCWGSLVCYSSTKHMYCTKNDRWKRDRVVRHLNSNLHKRALVCSHGDRSTHTLSLMKHWMLPAHAMLIFQTTSWKKFKSLDTHANKTKEVSKM